VISAGDRLLVIDSILKPRSSNHTPDFRRGCARRREVAVHEERIGWIQRQRLEATQIVFADRPRRGVRAGVKKSEEAQHFQTALRVR